MKNYRIYRKAAMKRLTSPEQLDRMLRTTSLHSWVGLSSVLVLFAAVIIWGTLTQLPIIIRGTGVIVSAAPTIRTPGSVECFSAPDMLPPEQNLQRQPELLVFVPAVQAAGIQTGASVLFRPAVRDWEGSRMIQGKVISISHTSFAFNGLTQSLQTQSLAQLSAEHGPMLQLRAAFADIKDPNIGPNNNQETVRAVLAPGTTGQVELIVGTQKPISMLISSAKARFGR